MEGSKSEETSELNITENKSGGSTSSGSTPSPNSLTDSVEHSSPPDVVSVSSRSPSSSPQKPGTSLGHGLLGKRKPSTSNSDSENSEILNTFKRKLANDIYSDTSRSDSISPLSSIPLKTSDWTDHLFPQLRITVDKTHEDPNDIFSHAYHKFLKDEVDMLTHLHKIYRKPDQQREEELKCYQQAVEHRITIDCNSLDDITFADLKHMETQMKSIYENSLVQGSMRKLWESTQKSLQVFLAQLFHMVRRRGENQGEVQEGMFTELFMAFVRIFELDIYGFSNVPMYKLGIGEEKVISIPDAIIYNPTHDDLNRDQVIAVIEVKKNYRKEEQFSCDKQLRSEKKFQQYREHLDSKVKGQHMGEMLSVLSSSIFGANGIFGFIVQGTNVTFVSLSIEKDYLECLASGDLRKKGGIVAYSRMCNILSKDGRLSLVQTLLDMATILKYLNSSKMKQEPKN